MKKITLIFLLLIPCVCMAQKDTLQSIIDKYIIEGRSLTYVSTYDIAGQTKNQVRDLVIKSLSTEPRVSIVQATISPDQVEGSFSNFNIDYKKYGFKWGNIAVWVLHPAFGSFTIQFKDEKYRVIVKQVKTVVNAQLSFDFNTDFVSTDGKIRGDNVSARRSLYAFGRNMDELFDVKKERKLKDW